MNKQERGRNIPSSVFSGGGELSSTFSARGLSLPAVHNRDTKKLLNLIGKEPLDEVGLRDFSNSERADTIFALVQSAARWLGENWVEDGIDFADLSVQMSRLHSIVMMTGDRLEPATRSPAIAVLLQPYDDHLLGGALLEARLRFAGIATEFFPQWTTESLEQFDGAFICVSNTDRRDELGRQIADIRASHPDLAIVVGGRGATADPAITTADLVSSSLLEAVEFCDKRRARAS